MDQDDRVVPDRDTTSAVPPPVRPAGPTEAERLTRRAALRRIGLGAGALSLSALLGGGPPGRAAALPGGKGGARHTPPRHGGKNAAADPTPQVEGTGGGPGGPGGGGPGGPGGGGPGGPGPGGPPGGGGDYFTLTASPSIFTVSSSIPQSCQCLITAVPGSLLPVNTVLDVSILYQMTDANGNPVNTITSFNSFFEPGQESGIETWICMEHRDVPYYANAPTQLNVIGVLAITSGNSDSFWLNLASGDDIVAGSDDLGYYQIQTGTPILPAQGIYTLLITGSATIPNVGSATSSVSVSYSVA